MVYLDYLDSFTVYKAKQPVIMPEATKNRKKNRAYVVLAPTIEQGFQFLSTTNNVKYRNLTKYFIPMKWNVSLYGSGHQIVKFDAEGEVSDLLSKYQHGNLSGIKKVDRFIPGKADPLKQFNVLVEVNYVFDTILNNAKDHRKLSVKIDQVLTELGKAIATISSLGNYEITTLIPLTLWFSHEDYTNPDQLWKPTTKNPMGHVLRSLLSYRKTLDLLAGPGENSSLVLLDNNTLIRLTPSKLPADSADGNEYNLFIKDIYKQFFTKAKKSVASVIDYGDDEETIKDAAAEKQLAQAKKETTVDLAQEKIEKDLKIDHEKLSDEKAAEVRKIAAKAVREKEELVEPEEEADTPEVDDTKLSQQEADVLLTAQMEGRSAESAKRNEMLKKKYTELKMGDTSIKQLVEEEKEVDVPTVAIHAKTLNPAMENITGQRFEEVYEENLMQHDLVNILLHFSTAKPAMYLNKDIKIVDVSTHVDRVIRYTVQFEDEDRKRHSFSFKLPKMYKHKYLYLNGQELVITHQKLPYPITKVSADRCQLVTNYNKLFIYRYGTALSPRMTKLKKILSGDKLPNLAIRKGDCTRLNSQLTTIEFDDFASNFVTIDIGNQNDNIRFCFDPEINMATISSTAKKPTPDGEDESALFPIAVSRKGSTKTQYWLSGITNNIYDSTGKSCGELSEFFTEKLIEYIPDAAKELDATTVGSRFIYSRVHIMDTEVPLILVMGAADPDGLIGALEKGKINYQFVDKRPKVDKNTTGVIPFADGYLVFDRYPYENSLLMNGLMILPTKEYNFYDLNTRDTYVDIFDHMCGRKTMADNLPAFYYMMVDPITKEVLNKLGQPTDFTTLLHFCNGVLVDNSYQIDSIYLNSRLRSTEIIMAHLYRELAVAWSNYRSGRTDTFSIPEDAIIKILLTSKIVDPKSRLNITLELENDRNVKLKGPSGMNEDHSFTIEKRAYHPTMRGIIGTNSTASGEVGICRHMVINPNILDARGFIDVNKSEGYDGTELMTPGEALSPFSVESADIERLCMSVGQAKHLVPVDSQCSPPISYDFERVAPYLSNDFAFQAKQDGQVVEIKDDIMIIKYKDGTFDDVDLSVHPAKNTDGGFYIMNNLSTNLTAGKKFKQGEILAYDKKYINDLDFFGDPSANVGTLARVAFECNGCVFEDSGYITDEFAHKFATHITRQKRVIISPFANIKYIAKVGQSVKANDPILAFDDTEDEFSSQLLASIADQAEDLDEIIATSAPVVSKFTGTIKDIDIVYTVPIEQMTPSLRKVVQDYSKEAAKREKTLSKYVSVFDANTITKNSTISEVDSQGKVGGVKIGEGVIIDFYIEYEDIAGNGDKGSIGALKFTTCEVIPTELAAYSENNPDKKIDLYVSAFGAFKRMVADVEKVGILTKVLVEEKRRMKEQYGEKIKAELKKK